MESGGSPVELFEGCITPTLEELGKKFEKLEVYLPELMRAADIVKDIRIVLEPVIRATAGDKTDVRGRVVIGTAKGDVHDIGKNMVSLMLQVNGFEVYDLGVDVPSGKFIEKAKEVRANIIAMSSLLTPTMPYMRDLILTLTELGDREHFKVIVGGGPVTPQYATSIHSDGYGKDAVEAVSLCKKIMGIK